MFNFFKSKKTDLELITELEKQIGEEIPRLEVERDIAEVFREINAEFTKAGNVDLDKVEELQFGEEGIVLNSNNRVVYFNVSVEKQNRTTLLETVVQLEQLLILDLSENELRDLPPEIGNLQNLTWLYLRNNPLSFLPPEIGNLQNLTWLILECNELSSLSPEIGTLQNLTMLALGTNQLSTLPPEIGNLQNLTSLSLFSNQLNTLPPEIVNLQNLTKLHLGSNKLSTLPPEIVNLQNLTELDLARNQLSTLPPEIVNLQNLTELNLGSNQLSTLPPEIVNLQNLILLILSDNQLSTLPPEIVNLQNLTSLDLSSNQLSTLPPSIVKMQNLTRLGLSSNQLTQFPKALLDLNLEVYWDRYSWKKGIHVKDNPFQTPPVEIVKQGRQAIIDYYAALEEQQKRPLNESKLILIGDGAAGKTSLMKRLLGLDFNPQESQTHGININTLTIKDNQNNDIKLHCWDFGGQLARQKFLLPQSCTPPTNFFSPNAAYTYSLSTVGVKPKSTTG
jgi:Leucine-rich repeat (LRR) protein